MHILCIGINHDTSPVHIREQFAFDPASDVIEKGELAGLVVLSTCNRVELYAVSHTKDFTALEELLAQHGRADRSTLSKYLYHYADETAIQHLMRVAAGLDSVVLGEPQILGQIIRAMQSALDQGSTHPLLNKVFQRAVHAGKRVRSETGIARNPTSIASMAVKLAAETLPTLHSTQVTVLGAGETASLVVGALRQRGVENLQVLNRTFHKAQELAAFWGGSARPLSELPFALQTSDLVISSITARQPIVQTAVVAEAMQYRPQRKLTLIDVAVPRNVTSETAQVPNVFLHNMDNLQMRLAQAVDLRGRECPHAENILAEELDSLNEDLREFQVSPLIAALYENAELIRKSEIDKTLKKLKSLSDTDQKQLDAMTRAIIKKLLHTPTKNLRAASHAAEQEEYLKTVRNLFDLSKPKK